MRTCDMVMHLLSEDVIFFNWPRYRDPIVILNDMFVYGADGEDLPFRDVPEFYISYAKWGTQAIWWFAMRRVQWQKY